MFQEKVDRMKGKGREFMEKIEDKSHELINRWEEKSRDFIGNFVELFGRDGRIVSSTIWSIINSLRPSDAIWWHRSGSTLVPDGTKPLPEPM